MRAATLFDADAASYSGTVEVIGVIYKAEDDGYAVLEVQETESGEGFALVGPVAHLEDGRPGRSQRRVADPQPLRPAAAGAGGAAARPGRPRRPDRLPQQPAPHRAEAGRASLRRVRRGGAAGDRRRSPAGLRLPARGQRRPGGGGDPVLVRQPGDPRPPRPARPAWPRPPGRADPRPLRRARDDDPPRGPLPADRGAGGRLRPRRQDRAGRRRWRPSPTSGRKPPPSTP